METPYYITDCPGRGRGVYTNRAYKTGEYVMTFTGQKTHIDQISDFTHYLQVAPDVFISPSGNADDFVNHSCDPNCALYFEGDALVLRAIKPIEPGQELFFDYGTIMFSEPTTFQCACGSPSCRGIIGNYYSLPEELKHKYRERNMVPLLSRYSLEEIQASPSR
ncbi:MAG TPA: SET domain-containing protein-lysine N-methyltransferase [Gammaproteobacteria bacterium]